VREVIGLVENASPQKGSIAWLLCDDCQAFAISSPAATCSMRKEAPTSSRSRRIAHLREGTAPKLKDCG